MLGLDWHPSPAAAEVPWPGPHHGKFCFSLTLKDAETTLAAGAFDYVPKELSSASLNILHLQNDLIAKIKAAAALTCGAVCGLWELARAASNRMRDASLSAPAIVAIGVSTEAAAHSASDSDRAAHASRILPNLCAGGWTV